MKCNHKAFVKALKMIPFKPFNFQYSFLFSICIYALDGRINPTKIVFLSDTKKVKDRIRINEGSLYSLVVLFFDVRKDELAVRASLYFVTSTILLTLTGTLLINLVIFLWITDSHYYYLTFLIEIHVFFWTKNKSIKVISKQM